MEYCLNSAVSFCVTLTALNWVITDVKRVSKQSQADSKQSQQPGDPWEFPVTIHGQGLGKITWNDHRTQRKMIHTDNLEQEGTVKVHEPVKNLSAIQFLNIKII